MDYLATFESTRSVMQAEQILMRKKVPFETVPHSQYQHSGCGLAIVFAAEHKQAVVAAIGENKLKMNLVQITKPIPS
jgi:hypothetical protein